jgi:hypothetical protein
VSVTTSLSCYNINRTRWHADVKPDNILQVKGKFKLADPGFATFEKREAFAQAEKRHAEAEKREEEAFAQAEKQHATTMIRGGTKTYGKFFALQCDSLSCLDPSKQAPQNATQEALTASPFRDRSISGLLGVFCQSQLHGLCLVRKVCLCIC